MKYVLSFCIALLSVCGAYAQCNPSFTVAAAAPNGNNLFPVAVTNTTVYSPPPNEYVNYSFDFGGVGNNISGGYNYSSAGTYTVTMTMVVWDSSANVTYCTNTATQTVTVAPASCETSISYSASANSASGEVIDFTSLNPAATNDLTYSWNFGDGSTAGTGPAPTHTYTANGTYTVTMTAASVSNSCSYQTTTTVYITLFDCAAFSAGFTYSTSYSSVNLTADDSSSNGNWGSISWDYGDGTSDNWGQHNYGVAGTFTVTLTETWTDPATGQTCTHSSTQQVTVGNPAPPPSIISGTVNFNNGAITLDSFNNLKVWLIKFDATTNLLTAVDSSYAYGGWYNSTQANYEFDNVPAGLYRTKAAIEGNQTVGAAGYVPTYYTSSLYWSGATVINHAANTTDAGENIDMQWGTVTSGPGFIGGDVTTGANKNTQDGDPVPDMLVFLRDASNTVIASTITATDGTYSFSNLPVGTYSVYPEDMNYGTFSYDNIVITAAQPSATSKKFRQHTVAQTITPLLTTGVANVANNTSISIYPNPNSGLLNIGWNQSATQHAHITISDITGRNAFETDFQMSAGQTQLNLSDLKDGIYNIEVRSENINYTQKLVLQH